MESSKTKIGVNILLVIAIVLTSLSLVSVITKKPHVEPITALPQTPPAQQAVVPAVASTTSEGTTTENVSTSTSTATTTLFIKGFTDKKWTWMKTSSDGTLIVPKMPTVFTITFNPDGTIKGTTDCNNFFGNYTVASGTLSLNKVGATQMFCDGSQEAEFMKVLQAVVGYTIDKTNNLVLTTKTGSTTMMFR